MIPREIEVGHIRKAARQIDANGVPYTRGSRVFDVVIHKKTYPPKYLLSVAAQMAGVELSAWNFITTEARAFLKKHGFKVVEKRKNQHSISTPIVVSVPCFVICWDDAAYRDVIPLSWLQEGPALIGVEHDMRDASARLKGRAKCDVRVASGNASFDYRNYRKFNGDSQVEFGVACVMFKPSEPLQIASVEWHPEDSPANVSCGTAGMPILQAEARKPYIPPKKATKKAAAFKRERPGQLKFRNYLKNVYGSRCCVSRCGVAEALEGAHIDPYRSPASDHPSNGLLLRRDLHALFDRHLISVNPDTGKVVIAECLSDTEYKEFEGVTPLPVVNSADAPDKNAVGRHFAAFRKKYC